MARVNDVGGMEGFGPLETAEKPPGFAADWEARVFALNRALIRSGVYTLDEFRDAIERMPAERYLASSYYEKWFHAVCTLLDAKGAVPSADLASALSGD